MPRFSIKDLLIATTLIAIGAGTLGYAFSFPREFKPGDPTVWFLILSVWGGYALIGAGMGTVFHRPWTGVALIFVVLLILLLLLPAINS